MRSDDKQRAASTTTSKDVQTDLAASEVTKWQQFYDKYLEHQLTLNEKLEWVWQPTTMNCDGMFFPCNVAFFPFPGNLRKYLHPRAAQRATRSFDSRASSVDFRWGFLVNSTAFSLHLIHPLPFPQSKLNDIISCSESSMAQRFDSKIEEVKSEMKFLTGRIEWVNMKGEKSIKQTASWKKFITHSPPLIWLLFLLLFFSPAQRHQQPPSHRQHAHETGANQQEVGRGEDQMHEGRQELPQDANGERKSEKFNWALACVVWQRGKMEIARGREGRKTFRSTLIFITSLHTLELAIFNLSSIVRRLAKVKCTDTNFLFTSSCDIWDILSGRIYDPVEGSMRILFMKDPLDVLKNAVYSFKAVFVLPFIAR